MKEKYNVSSSPHIRDKVTSSNIMLYVVIALLPATFFGIWNFRHENAWISTSEVNINIIANRNIFAEFASKVRLHPHTLPYFLEEFVHAIYRNSYFLYFG